MKKTKNEAKNVEAVTVSVANKTAAKTESQAVLDVWTREKRRVRHITVNGFDAILIS